ncbi:DEAD/DEAH box helicase [Vagococcus sp. JNUCC 83]
MYHKLQGRQLLKRDIPKKFWKRKISHTVITVKGMTSFGKYIQCNRCGHRALKQACQMTDGYYCLYCINMGRVTSKSKLYRIPRLKRQEQPAIHCAWEGKLTVRQQQVADDLIESYLNGKHHFIHAVTGAGKTEMLFPLIEKGLSDGKNIGIATPRIDVCLELFPRLTKAFPSVSINLLYGSSDHQFDGASLVICTTHQLMRFYHYFDVLVIDEADAFPYVKSKELQFGAKQAMHEKGMSVFLTATSNNLLDNQLNTDKSIVSRRFHGRDLPVPEDKYCHKLSTRLKIGILPKKLIHLIDNQQQALILFFPDISQMIFIHQVIKKRWPDKRIEAVYAASKTREEAVQKMREGEIDVLLSTTILERGVTFKNISVCVVCADHQVFNRSTLIQIAGRVGRHSNYPDGDVLFLHEGKTRAIAQAIKEIKQMNRR